MQRYLASSCKAKLPLLWSLHSRTIQKASRYFVHAGLPVRLYEKILFCYSSRFTLCIGVFYGVCNISLSAEESFLRTFYVLFLLLKMLLQIQITALAFGIFGS